MLPLSNALRLDQVICELADGTDDAWLYIPTAISMVTPATIYFRDEIDADLDEIEKHASECGLKEFISICDLEDILSNLKQQLDNPTENEIFRAINYFWHNDAFIKL